MLVIGLTGGIGSGKSTVAELFSIYGIAVIDADQITHELSAPGGGAYAEIVRQFGAGILCNDKTIDRALLREIVFTDQDKLKQLEQILHPMVRQRIAFKVSEVCSPYCIVVVPLLIESGMTDQFDRILVVDCDPRLQLLRATDRDDVSEEQIRQIMSQQVDRETRLAAADDVISNDTDIETLKVQVNTLHQRYLELATARH
jgi:dephospho-CoA kinase